MPPVQKNTFIGDTEKDIIFKNLRLLRNKLEVKDKIIFVDSPMQAILVAGFLSGIFYLQKDHDLASKLLGELQFEAIGPIVYQATQWSLGSENIALHVFNAIKEAVAPVKIWGLEKLPEIEKIQKKQFGFLGQIQAFFAPHEHGILRHQFHENIALGVSPELLYPLQHFCQFNARFSFSGNDNITDRVILRKLFSNDGIQNNIKLSLCAKWLIHRVNIFHNYNSHSMGFEAKADFYPDYTKDVSVLQMYNIYRGQFIIQHKDFCVMSDRPEYEKYENNPNFSEFSLRNSNQYRLHNDKGPAKQYRDGWKTHAIHGRFVPGAEWLDNPSLLTVRQIQNEQDPEIAQVMLERYGIKKYLQGTRAIKIQQDTFGKLWYAKQRHQEPLVVVEVVDATPMPGTEEREIYFLRVPPRTRTAREGIAWTFDMPQEELYAPQIET